MPKWKLYRKTAITRIRSYEPGEDLNEVSIDKGYDPHPGDMIATDGRTTWLMNEDFFNANYVEVEDGND